jgi:putative spermidine/putrescine transport system permease protein
MTRMGGYRVANRLFVWSVLVYLALPMVVVAVASVTRTGDMRFPPSGFSLRWYAEFLTGESWLRALGTSLLLAALGAMLSTALAFLAASAARRRFPLRGVFEATMLSPLIVPHAALALALFGIVVLLRLRGSLGGLLVAHIVLTLPFAYRPIATSLSQLDRAMEEAGMSLGAHPWTIMRRITLPLLRPAIVSALLFCSIISFDEVTVSMFLVGPEVMTLPVRIFSEIQDRDSPVLAAISTLLILVTLGCTIMLDRLIGLQLFVRAERGKAPPRPPAA